MPPTFCLERRQAGRKGTISTLSPLPLREGGGKKKQVPGVQEKPERYGREAVALTPLNSVFMKSPRKSPLWSRRSEREEPWGRALWRACQSAAVGSLKGRCDNHFLIQKADHIERWMPRIVFAEVCTKLECTLPFFLHAPRGCRRLNYTPSCIVECKPNCCLLSACGRSLFYFCLFCFISLTHVKCHDDSRPYITLQGGRFQHVESEFGFLSVFFFFIPMPFQRKTVPVFEQAKTSGCTLANHVISGRIYPNKARSNTIPLWLPNGFCIIHLDPYNNTGSLGGYFQISQISLQEYNS